jgi:hypothetical protein
VVFPLASSQPAVSVDVVIILPEVIIRNEQPGVAYSGKNRESTWKSGNLII